MMSDYLRGMRDLIGTRAILLPGVQAIIPNDAGEILLQHRTDMDCWGLPSGSLELDETALETLRREVEEEAGVRVIEAEPMALYSGPAQKHVYSNGDEIICFTIAFIIRRWEGEPRADGEEGSEVRFFPLSNPPSNLVPLHVRTLADYRRYNGRFLVP